MSDVSGPLVLVGVDCRELGLDPNASRCDFVFFSDSGNLVAALELKRGKIEARQLVRQLQAGADLADRLVPAGNPVRFIPVAAYGGKAHRNELAELAHPRSQIRFRGDRTRIELLRCGQTLVQAIRKAGVG